MTTLLNSNHSRSQRSFSLFQTEITKLIIGIVIACEYNIEEVWANEAKRSLSC